MPALPLGLAGLPSGLRPVMALTGGSRGACHTRPVMAGHRFLDLTSKPRSRCRAAVCVAVAGLHLAGAAVAASANRNGWLGACAGSRAPGTVPAAGAPPEDFWADVLPWKPRQDPAAPAAPAPMSGATAPLAEPGGDASRRLAALAFPPAVTGGLDADRVAETWLRREDVSVLAAAPADRWGRQPVLVFAEGDLLNAALLRAGLAWFRSGDVPFACARLLQSEEEAARRARRGIWAGAVAVLPAEQVSGILAREGRFALVEGRVRSVGQTKSRLYLNFGAVRSQDFAIAIEKRNLRKFEASGMTGGSWEGRRVRVRGIVVQAGGPLIEVSSPEDVERLE